MFPFRRNVLAFAALLAFSSPVIAGKLAIVIDDFGYRPHNENQVLAMPSAISVAVLPDSPHAREVATKAHNSGHEVLIDSTDGAAVSSRWRKIRWARR